MSITFQIISLVLMQIHIHNVCDGVNCCVYCYAIYSEMNFISCLKSAIVSIFSLCRFLCVFLLNLKHMCMLNAHFILTKASMLHFLRVILSYSKVNVMMNKLKRFKPSQLNKKKYIEFAEHKEEFLLNRNLVHFWTI